MLEGRRVLQEPGVARVTEVAEVAEVAVRIGGVERVRRELNGKKRGSGEEDERGGTNLRKVGWSKRPCWASATWGSQFTSCQLKPYQCRPGRLGADDSRLRRGMTREPLTDIAGRMGSRDTGQTVRATALV